MKTIVSVQEISEFEIKPHVAVARWRELVQAEVKRRWANRSSLTHIVCPYCGQNKTVAAFERCGLFYVECPECGSLYAPYRPDEDELWRWYRESVPARFWREQLLPASEETRLEKVTRPRADWVLDGIAEYVPSACCLVDISPYGRRLVELVTDQDSRLTKLIAAGMTADLEGVSTSRIQVKPSRVASLPGLGPADGVIAIDVMDRAADPAKLVEALKQLVAPGGVIFATTPVASGFEIQTLWERSPTIIPPDKLNLPTVSGLQRLFAAPTWDILELSTPGMFDVEMVRRAIEADPNRDWPRVVRTLVERSGPSGRKELVEFLQANRLTSFARLVIRKKSDAGT